MDQNVVFRWIWRFNAIAIAIFLLLIGSSFLPYFMWRVAPAVESVTGPILEQPTTKQPDLRLFLDFTREGRREMVFALAPEANVSEKFSSPDESRLGANIADPTRVVNYLFIDPTTGATRWLFPTNDQVITATDYVTKNMSDRVPQLREAGPALAVVYDVKPLQRVGAPTKYQVYVSRLDGTNLTRFWTTSMGPLCSCRRPTTRSSRRTN